MNIQKDFDEIIRYAHMWDWLPDWDIVKSIYKQFPESYSVLTPFAYSYLEELIRSTTSDYGKLITNQDTKNIGAHLLDLAIKENKDNPEYIKLLKEYKKYFKKSSPIDTGNNRNSVMHAYSHPREWSKESFENLIHDIATISKFANF